jgi:hypothetical protein
MTGLSRFLSPAWTLAIAALAAGALVGCGGRSTGASPSTAHRVSVWSAASCREQTQAITDDTKKILHDFRLGTTEPPDVPYLGLESALSEFQRHDCKPQILGRTLARRFTHRQLTELLRYLPSPMVRYVRRTMACWQAHGARSAPSSGTGAASACNGTSSTVPPVIIGKPYEKRYPLNPGS